MFLILVVRVIGIRCGVVSPYVYEALHLSDSRFEYREYGAAAMQIAILLIAVSDSTSSLYGVALFPGVGSAL